FLVLLIGGIGASFWGFTLIGRRPEGRSTGTFQYPALSPVAHPTVTAGATFAPNSYPRLAASYYGHIDDLQANVPSQMALTQMRQNGGNISGFFSGLQMSGT